MLSSYLKEHPECTVGEAGKFVNSMKKHILKKIENLTLMAYTGEMETWKAFAEIDVLQWKLRNITKLN